MASVSQLLLLLLCGYHSLIAHAGDEQSYKVLATDSLKPKSVCSEPKVAPSSSGRATVPLNHRHGPCSPVPSEKKLAFAELLRRDQLRAGYIQRKFSKNDGTGEIHQSKVTVPTTLGSSLDKFEQYVITVQIGSPAVTQTMIMDTGSDVSWVQCNPCPIPPCHSPTGSLFDPNSSSTYAPFSCGSAACAQLGENGGCSDSQCQYIVRYFDGSNTTGTYGSDTLALTGSDVVKNFQFGCSHAESGLINDQLTDGLMGLGGDTQSLVSQTAATYGSAFSYCLPPTNDSSGFLTLGAPSGASGFATTPMLRSRQAPTFYRVLLQGITVAGKQLSVTPSVFSAGSVMDSGTIFTQLPPTAYSALSSAFKDGMKQYPPAQPRSPFDTCFDFSGQDNVTITSVALVFSGGAVVDLDANGIMFDLDPNVRCLAFVATDDDGTTGIIGNVQQRTFEVLYDVGQSVVGFRPRAC